MYEDLIYEATKGVAIITINRPNRLNAFREATLDELVRAFHEAWRDPAVGVIILTGAGNRSFCVGGDADGRYEADRVELLQDTIRAVPKPVIAAVNGLAIGGGHVLQMICDLTIACESARFGQVGPRVGSVDPGYGTALLARSVGIKKAFEIWSLCDRYTPEEALRIGLINKVVPDERLMEEAWAWARELLKRSPTALRIVKASLIADTSGTGGLARLGYAMLPHFLDSAEAREARAAFQEKRDPAFGLG
jgi:2-ketocyclohexanecarboxyl-CoA hydrolase